MRRVLQNRLIHAVLSLMLSAGLTGPVLSYLLPGFPLSLCITAMLLTVAGFELLCLNKKTAMAGCLVLTVVCLVWLFSGHGTEWVRNTLRGLSLRLSGHTTALPLIRDEITLLVTVILSLISCIVLTGYFSMLSTLILCAGTLMLIWLTRSSDLIPAFLPALTVLLLLLMADRFPETSRSRLLPWAALLVLLAFGISFLLGGSVSIDPWKNQADEWRQAILDRLFFTEPRDVFSLASEGYYPQGAGQLGGKPNPDDHLVMQVSTPRITHLRGVIFNRYDGHAWRNTTGGRRYLWQSSRNAAERDMIFNQSLPVSAVQNSLSEPKSVSVRMLSDSASTLFVPQRIRSLEPGGELVPYFSNSSEVFITRNLEDGDTYAAAAPLYLAGDPGLGTLIRACESFDDPGYDAASQTFLELPDHLEDPVWALAADLVSGAETSYDKALAIRNWLTRTCRYTLDVETHPVNIDFVTHFLLSTRQGYCTYFASAMTVLCRMAGLPARYVEGYLAIPDQTGNAVVTGLNAHAWTEVYFKGFGWLTFDATPASGPAYSQSGSLPPSENAEPDDTSPTPAPTPSPSPEAAPDGTDTLPSDSPEPTSEEVPTPTPAVPDTDSPSPSPSESPESNPPDQDPPAPSETPPSSPQGNVLPWILLLIALSALLLRIRFTAPSVRERRFTDPEKRLSVWMDEIRLMLRACRLERQKGETPNAFARRVDNSGLFSADMKPVGEILSASRYSTEAPREEDLALVRSSAAVLRHELTPPCRLRYWLMRCFLPSGFSS